jgi:mannose-6-phosphate isomerase-like protein (cupin superfamily)
MQAFELGDVIDESRRSARDYLEFLRTPDLSMGVYRLPAGGTDSQSPHTEDEAYYIIGGRATIRVADEDRQVRTGSLVYVAKNVEHRFHSIEEALTALVFFAPAENTRSSAKDRQ